MQILRFIPDWSVDGLLTNNKMTDEEILIQVRPLMKNQSEQEDNADDGMMMLMKHLAQFQLTVKYWTQ